MTANEIQLQAGESALVSWQGDARKLPQLAKLPAVRMQTFKNAALVELASVVEQLQSAPRFVFKGQAANRRFSGTINVADVDRVIAALRTADPELTIERNG